MRMEDNVNINADWAKERATSVKNGVIAQELAKCESAIKHAAESAKMECTISGRVMDATLLELRSRGFVVKVHDDQRDGDYTHIRWN